MNYYKKQIYFTETNQIIKDLAKIYSKESKGLELTKNGNWAFYFQIRIYKSEKFFRKSRGGNGTAGACFNYKIYNKKDIEGYLKDDNWYINLGYFAFYKKKVYIDNVYHEANHCAFAMMRILDLAGFKSSWEFREELFNHLSFINVEVIRGFYKDLTKDKSKRNNR